MRRRTLSLVGAAAGIAPILIAVLPAGSAGAHGYISEPLSRQAQCAQGVVSCGEVSNEPQSVEGPQGLNNCSADKYPELDDDSLDWKAEDVDGTVDFTWTNTAEHQTENWQYYIGDTLVEEVDGKNEMPGETVTHNIDVSEFSGEQKLVGVWNIGDTENAFYSCVDLNIAGDGSGGGEQKSDSAPTGSPESSDSTTPSTPSTTSTQPSSTPSPSTSEEE